MSGCWLRFASMHCTVLLYLDFSNDENITSCFLALRGFGGERKIFCKQCMSNAAGEFAPST